jgi:hypothetical protein
VPRTPSPASRTSLYRLTSLPDLLDGVRERYRENDTFEVTALQVEGRDALLVRGTMETPTVSWAVTLHELTGQTIELGNSTAAAALLIRAADSGGPIQAVDDDVADGGNEAEDAENPKGGDLSEDLDVAVAWALTYGMGFQLLEMARSTQGSVSASPFVQPIPGS